MKTLYLLKSLLSSNKKYITIISVCFILTAFLFNLSVAVTEDYIAKKIYISRTDYENRYAVLRFSSYSPNTDENIGQALKEAEIDSFFCDYFSGYFLPYEDTSLSQEDVYTMTESDYEKYFNDVRLYAYSTEYSEEFETAFVGEKPDANKDYGGNIPVIASYKSGLSIGDTVKSNYFGKAVTFVVTAKYSDSNLETFFEIENKMIFTDREFLYKYGMTERPENQPELSVGGDNMYNRIVFVRKPDNISVSEFKARIRYLTDKLSDDKTKISVENNAILTDSDVDIRCREIIMLIPIIILIFGIGTMGTVANLLISTDKRKNSYKIFRICNARKGRLYLLTTLCEFTVTLFSLGVALLLSYITDLLFKDQLIRITQSLISPTSVIITTAMVVGITLIMIILQMISGKVSKEKIL